MKYTYREGIKRQASRRWFIIPIVGVLVLAYMLVNAFAPHVYYVIDSADTTAKRLISSQPDVDENRLYAPKINLTVNIVADSDNEAAALSKGAIQRVSSSGNPKDGGNYVVAAHSFKLGLTPGQTKSGSPFYFIGRLANNDDIYIDYRGTRYAYKVTERKQVAEAAAEIESRTENDQLTLYSWETGGPGNTREVVLAKPVGKIIWSNGQARLQALPND